MYKQVKSNAMRRTFPIYVLQYFFDLQSSFETTVLFANKLTYGMLLIIISEISTKVFRNDYNLILVEIKKNHNQL